MSRPNILVVMADQLAPHFTGAYGHPLVRTPAIEDLAERGTRFDAAYCHSPLCAPARFTMLSGQPVSAIGAWDNAAEFPASVPTLAHYLAMTGYRTVLSGKMHFVGPDQLHGFEERLTTDIYPADFAWTPNWDEADTRIGKWYHNMDSLAEAGQALATYQIDYDEEVGFASVRRLYDLARESCKVDLPADARWLISNLYQFTEVFALWDLLHDKSHYHGALPLLQFTENRSQPFWMGALEELRVDLCAFRHAEKLLREGIYVARWVQYAIVFDRLFRFPIVGQRQRNYDALVGQILFGALYSTPGDGATPTLTWLDGILTIDWSRLPARMEALLREIEEILNPLATRELLWARTHDFVANYVQPNPGSIWKSRWEAGADSEALMDAVLADEFPLSVFYSYLAEEAAEIIQDVF